MEREHILIIEDDAAVSIVLAELLDETGYRTTVARTLAAARWKLGKARFDLVLCDILLPDGNAAVDLRSQAPCLFMAGHPQAIAEFEREGSHYLRKPFKLDELLPAIRDCLDRGKCSRHPIAV